MLVVAGSSVLALVIFLVTLYWYHVKLFFDESLYVEKGSYQYELLISDSIKSLPVFEALPNSVRYHYSSGDGNKPQSDSLEYQSKQPKKAILDFYKRVLEERGYQPRHAEYVTDNNLIYGDEKKQFVVYVRDLGSTKDVSVDHQEIKD